jgi:hypothetical protein
VEKSLRRGPCCEWAGHVLIIPSCNFLRRRDNRGFERDICPLMFFYRERYISSAFISAIEKTWSIPVHI